MKKVKNRKIASKIVKNNLQTRKNAVKKLKYERLPKIRVIKKIEKFLSKHDTIFAEYKLKENLQLIREAEKFVNQKAKTRYRKTDEVVVIKCAKKIVDSMLAGGLLNDAIKEALQKFRLYQKEIKALRKAVCIVALREVLFNEEAIYSFKKDIQKGKDVKSEIIELSPAVCFGIMQSENLGLFLDRKQELKNGLDLLVIDAKEHARRLSILINVLIKCMA